MNIDRYIQKAVKREMASQSRIARRNDGKLQRKNKRHNDAAARRRIMDSAVKSIRYNDGIKDLFIKVKDKVSEAVDTFKQLPAGRKIAVILGSIASVSASIFAAKNLAQMASDYKRLRGLKSDLESSYEALKSAYEKKGLALNANSPMDTASDYDKMKLDLLGQAIKSRIIPTVIAIVGAFLAFVSAKVAKAQKSVSEGANEREVVSEVIAER